MTRGRGRRPRPVARSQTREDHTTTPRWRVGELQPELYFLAVSGKFHDLVKRTQNQRRASRARSGGVPGRAQPVAFARRARRCLAGLARRTGSELADCT